MKAQMKAIGAMAVVVALALVAVSGVTYSWFSDSETSNIDISTAKIDIDGKYNGNAVVKDLNGSDVTDTKAKFINDNKDISITNMNANRSVTANYELANNSSVPVKYRMYVVVSGIDDDFAEKSISVVAADGNTLVLNSPLDFDKGIAYVTSGDGVVIDNKGTFDFTVRISFDIDVTSSVSGFSVKICNEAYQYDYKYAPVSIMTSGSADLPVSGKQTADVKVVGNTDAESTVEATDVEVTFSAGAYNTATDDGTKQVTLKTKMLSSGGNTAKIQLSLYGATDNDFGDSYVTVSLVIPGVFTDLNVVYSAEGSQPEIISCTNDGTNTTVVFKTTHFSDYVIYKNKLYVDSEFMLNFALSNGIGAVLADDIEVKEPVVASTKCTLDLNGHTISNTGDVWNEDIDNWSLISVREGGDLTINGNGILQAKENDCYAVDIQDGSRCTINGGKYIGNIHAVYVHTGSLLITSGEYSVQQKYPVTEKADEFVINLLDENRKNGTATATITGGTYHNFNPSDCQAEGANTNFVKDGYHVIKDEDNYLVSKYEFTGNNVVFDGTNYYTSMVDALKGIHKTDKHELWCRPGADLGAMVHGHVCADLTIHGNGAYISGDERDFEIDTYTMNGCTGLASDVTLTVYSLNNMAVWGERHTEHTINIILEGCMDMNRVYLTGCTGPINVTIKNCSFNGDIAGNATALYTNAVGKISVENTVFNKYTLGVNQNNKSGGLQTISLTDCIFNDCGYAYQAGWSGFCSPVRIVASADGSNSIVIVDNCVFNNSDGKESVRGSDYLFGDDRDGESVLGTVTFNGKVVEQLKPSAN